MFDWVGFKVRRTTGSVIIAQRDADQAAIALLHADQQRGETLEVQHVTVKAWTRRGALAKVERAA